MYPHQTVVKTISLKGYYILLSENHIYHTEDLIEHTRLFFHMVAYSTYTQECFRQNQPTSYSYITTNIMAGVLISQLQAYICLKPPDCVDPCLVIYTYAWMQ